jgi:hypothetical protein
LLSYDAVADGVVNDDYIAVNDDDDNDDVL